MLQEPVGLHGTIGPGTMKSIIRLGAWTEDGLTGLLEEASVIADPGSRVAFLSARFLGTKYEESTLSTPGGEGEDFVIDLAGIDCFTFIEYVEAMRRSTSFPQFRDNLRFVRYRAGNITFRDRNHFFTDWKAFNADHIVDVTARLGAEKTKDVSKRLNEQEDGTLFLPGVPCRVREVTYIQSIHVSQRVCDNLKTGDYAGIYSKKDGLDVSHTGIVIRERGAVLLRHASSLKKHRKVIDEDLREYLTAKAGIIVLRARTVE